MTRNFCRTELTQPDADSVGVDISAAQRQNHRPSAPDLSLGAVCQQQVAGFLLDTNVLVYSYDPTDGEKRTRAIDVLETLGLSPEAYLSTQVLGEFYVTVTRKIPSPLSVTDASLRIQNYVEAWNVCDVTVSIVSEAVRGAHAHQLAYYDALIWATARLNQITSVITEDGQHNRLIEGIRYLNPFDPDFDLQLLQPSM